ncbi:MAG: tRNA1(Val) (adenine(37)-N6)-methyltransferase [Thermodesulfovibrionales bacterium]|nr:tRNA1(Val) (adenine(37)-N6)-methyltransferase [Thermodesulfovibrionales bacterium]
MLTLDSIRDLQIYQNKDGYRFSVDALLLFSFINLPRVKKIADLGAGSGIIGLLLAKKYPNAEITLIELQKNLAKLAEKNVVLNNLDDRVKTVTADIKNLSSLPHCSIIQAHQHSAFDLVVSNPPFRKPKTGLISSKDEKAVARHEISLPLHNLIRAVAYLLRHHGRFCVIYLPERLTEMADVMKKYSLEPKRLRFVHSSIHSMAKIVLIEAVKGGKIGLKIERPLFIYNEDNSYTDEMKSIYAC